MGRAGSQHTHAAAIEARHLHLGLEAIRGVVRGPQALQVCVAVEDEYHPHVGVVLQAL